MLLENPAGLECNAGFLQVTQLGKLMFTVYVKAGVLFNLFLRYLPVLLVLERVKKMPPSKPFAFTTPDDQKSRGGQACCANSYSY